jgi:hypothetical protein
MPATPLPALQSGHPSAWEEAVYAFLVEKRARSGSTRTVESRGDTPPEPTLMSRSDCRSRSH